jgi:hypothetical protein
MFLSTAETLDGLKWHQRHRSRIDSLPASLDDGESGSRFAAEIMPTALIAPSPACIDKPPATSKDAARKNSLGE